VFVLIGVAQRMAVHHLGQLVDKCSKIVRQIEPVFESYRITFKELKGKMKQPPSHCFNPKKKMQNTERGFFFVGVRLVIRGYFAGALEPETLKWEG
jgi:hypothetical protein